jgi:hypothetical protein
MQNNNVLIYAAALALLAFAACRSEVKEDSANGEIISEEESSGIAIRFTDSEVSSGMMRSMGDLDKASLVAMTVYAHYTGADNFADSLATTTPNFMFAQPVNKINNAWTYSPLKYWPAQHRKVSFFAVAPAPVADNGIELVTSGGSYYTGYPSFTVTPLAAPAQQLDICVASAQDCTGTANGGKVHLNFTHAMAKVRFAARYVSAKNEIVTLEQLKFTCIYTANTLRFTEAGFKWDLRRMAQAKAPTPYPQPTIPLSAHPC